MINLQTGPNVNSEFHSGQLNRSPIVDDSNRPEGRRG